MVEHALACFFRVFENMELPVDVVDGRTLRVSIPDALDSGRTLDVLLRQTPDEDDEREASYVEILADFDRPVPLERKYLGWLLALNDEYPGVWLARRTSTGTLVVKSGFWLSEGQPTHSQLFDPLDRFVSVAGDLFERLNIVLDAVDPA